MLAYAANRPVAAQRRSSPNAMLGIIAAHVAVVAVVMSAKMELPPRFIPTPTIIDFIKQPRPPEPTQKVEPRVKQPPIESTLDQPRPEVSLPPTGSQMTDATPSLPNSGPIVGPSVDPGPRIDPVPLPQPVRLEAKLLTPASELKPPYPESKLLSGEEALLRLRLTIDERGRVVAVEPVGKSDRVFLEAARRYLVAHWRYRPASEDGRAVATSIVIALRFQLDG
jgi:protein TonB